ncbi:MAG: serine hydrolase [Myxococcaceae bacterium]|nr:serine hydrolase [Myxococcaceae bacterium]
MTSLLVLALLAQPCPTRPSWPTTDWPVGDLQAVRTNRAAQVKALEDYLLTLTGEDSERKGLRTDALLIVKSGTIIYEAYARGWRANQRHISWSVAKSVTTALTGVAVLKGALTIDQSICEYVPAREELCPITIRHMMEFGSGMHWQEAYENQTYQYSSVISMLFGEGRTDNTTFVLSHRKAHEPGTTFNYSTGEAALLSEIVRQAGIKKGFDKDWFWADFFDRIGMKSAVLSGDIKGAPGGGSYVFATARDFARFGYLYLNDGCWEDRRVLPEGWVKSSTTMSETFRVGAPDNEDTPNGWMIWLNEVAPKKNARPWKDAPPDAYSGIGHWGQFVAVVPSEDLVIVRLGDDRNESVDLNKLIPMAIEVAK